MKIFGRSIPNLLGSRRRRSEDVMFDDADQLDDEEIELLTLIDDMTEEVEQFVVNTPMFQGDMTLSDAWVLADRRFLGDHWDHAKRAGLHYFTDNRTQKAVIDTTAVQNEQGSRIKITARETGDPPMWALSRRAGRELQAAILELEAAVSDVTAEQDPSAAVMLESLSDFTEGQLAGEEPITDAQSELVMELMQPRVTPDGVEQPPVLDIQDDQVLIAINDALFAEIVQTLYDAKFNEAFGDFYVTENELFANIYGHQFMVFQYDAETHEIELHNPHPFAILPDPSKTRIERMDYLIHEELMSIERAKHNWPDAADQLEMAAGDGDQFVSDMRRRPEPLRSIDYGRKMVTIRTTWLRNRMFPAEPHEAIERGLVEEADDGTYTVGPEGLDGMEPGTPIEPNGEGWPEVRGILQVRDIREINYIIDRHRCPYLDIPSALNINIPVPHAPFGMGDPIRLDDLQLAINRLFSMIYNVVYYNQTPQSVLSKSMVAALKEMGGSLHAHPGRTFVMDDQVFEDLVKTGFKALALDPATVPDSWVDLLKMLIEQHQDLSGDTDSLQGRPAFSGVSGRATELLQNAAKGTIRFKAQYTEWMLERLARLIIDAIVKWLPDAEWDKYISKYPPVILELMRERKKSMKFDVSAALATGRGLEQLREETRAEERYQAGLSTLEMTLEKLGDPNPKDTAEAIMAETAARGAQHSGE